MLAHRPAAVRAAGYWMTRYRKVWRGTLITLLAQPLLFFAAFGLGVGRLVDRNGAELPGSVDYAEFLAPGLLAGTVVLTAFFEAAWPVVGALKWHRAYWAQQASPLREADIAIGHQLFMGFRAMLVAAVFVVVMTVFGVVGSPLILAAVLIAPLVGWSFSAPMAAFAVSRESDQVLVTVSRFVVQPLFLLSGTFFPIDQLPVVLRQLAWLSPVFHAAELFRNFNRGELPAVATAGHLAYLVAAALLGALVAAGQYRKRLHR